FFNDMAQYQQELGTKNEQLEALRTAQQKANNQSETNITQLKSQLTASQTDAANHKKNAAELAVRVQQLDNAQTGFFNDMAQYQQELGTKNEQLEALRTAQQKANSQSETNITQLKSQLTASQTDAANHKKNVAELAVRVQQLDNAQTGFFNDISKYQQELNAKNQQLEALHAHLKQIEAKQNKEALERDAQLIDANSLYEQSTVQLTSQIKKLKADAAESALRAQQLDTAQTGFFNDIAQYQEALNTKNQQLQALRAQQEKDAQQSEALLAEANSRHEKSTAQLKTQITKYQTEAADTALKAQHLNNAQTG
ncbi:MAG: hypothetical protein ABW185_13235, partial [Sedimenticola sp.]